jgi:hypothetical protein
MVAIFPAAQLKEPYAYNRMSSDRRNECSLVTVVELRATRGLGETNSTYSERVLLEMKVT